MSLTLDEWRREADLVAMASRVVRSKEFRAMMDVLRSQALSAFDLPILADNDQRAAAHSMRQGYVIALRDIEALASHYKPSDNIEPTFEEPEDDEIAATEN